MTRWRDPIALATILGPIIAVIITYIIPSIPLPVTPMSTQTQPHESKPVDETGQIGKSKAVERRDVPPYTQCNDSYPDVCIQSDIDCSEILMSNFKVKGSDPYNLDVDGDGIACERLDKDCSEILMNDFKVKGSDPYNLDVDGDGIACER